MRTSLLLRDHPLHSFGRKISRHPASLVTASARALSGLPDAGATMSRCQGQDLPRCVWCAPSFCWGIIKRGNGVGRTESKKQEEEEEEAWTEQMHAAVNYVELLICCLVVFFFLHFLFFFFPAYFCWTVSHQNLVLKFCSKSPLPTCNYKYQFGLLRTTLRNEITHEIFFFFPPSVWLECFPSGHLGASGEEKFSNIYKSTKIVLVLYPSTIFYTWG